MGMVSIITPLLIISIYVSEGYCGTLHFVSSEFFHHFFIPSMPTFLFSVAAKDIHLYQTPFLTNSCPIFGSLLSWMSSLKASSCFHSLSYTLNLHWLKYGCCELCTCSYLTLITKFLQISVSKGYSGRNLKITVEHTMQSWILSLYVPWLPIQFHLKTVLCNHSHKI